MESILLPIMIAGAVALLAWWAVSMAAKMSGGEHRRLKKRLGAGLEQTGTHANLSLSLMDDAKDPDFLTRKPFLQPLKRRLSQVFPDLTLKRFLLIVGAMATLPLALG